MEDFKFLKILDHFRKVYENFGVDYQKMRLILGLKLTLDSRTTSTVFNNSQNEDKKEEKNSFFGALIMYALMGLFIGIIVMSSNNSMYSFSIAFGILMFFILTIFISDFSRVLLDIRDKNLIGIRGIDNRTISAAKITHICYYILLTSVSLSWLLIIAMFRFGILTGIMFIAELIIIDIFMVVITALIYLVIMKAFDGEKVKDIINYVQIVLVVVMTVGYQFLGRMFDVVDFNISFKTSLWNVILPPMWFASPLYAINGGNIDGIIISMMILAVVVPVAAIIIYLKNIGSFEGLLSKLNVDKITDKEKRRGIFYKAGYHICRNNEERAAYVLSTSLMKKEREFKLAAYPSMAFGAVFPFIFLFLYGSRGFGGLGNLSLVASLTIYWFGIMMAGTITTIRYSANYKGAWVYEAAFMYNQSNIYKGAYKALFINMLFPLYIIESAVYTFVFGVRVIPVLVIAMLFFVLLMIIMHIIGKAGMPFTVKPGVNDKTRDTIVAFLNIFVILAGAGINFLLISHLYWMLAYGAVLLVVSVVLWKKAV